MTRRPLDVMLTIGHDLWGPGARGQGIPERYFMGAWAPAFARSLRVAGFRTAIDYRRIEDGEDRYQQLIARCSTRAPRVLIDLHFNSGGYPGVGGLHRPGHTSGRRLVELVTRYLSEAQGTKAHPPRDHAGADGRPRAWTGTETQSADGQWYPAGSPLYLLELPDPIVPVVLELFDGSVEADHASAVAALRAGKTQAALTRAVSEFLGG